MNRAIQENDNIPEGAMALPADFPQPPADRESLAAAVAWMFQVLSWLIARAAAGDRWWLREEDAQPGNEEQAESGWRDRTGRGGAGETARSAETDEAATKSGTGAARFPLPSPGVPEPPQAPLLPGQETTPDAPPWALRTAPATIRTAPCLRNRRSVRQANEKTPGIAGPGRHPVAFNSRSAAGPPPKTGIPAKAPSCAQFVTLSKQ
jgi:hypothetical protein